MDIYGNQGVARQKSFESNLKGGKLIKLGNQGEERQKSFEFEFKGREIKNIGKSREGEVYFSDFY